MEATISQISGCGAILHHFDNLGDIARFSCAFERHNKLDGTSVNRQEMRTAENKWISALDQVEMIMKHRCTNLQMSRTRLASPLMLDTFIAASFRLSGAMTCGASALRPSRDVASRELRISTS